MLSIFVDYDNLSGKQQADGLLSVIEKVISQLVISERVGLTSRHSEVRVYGGWYEGDSMTAKGEELVARIGEEFPHTIRVPVNDSHFSIHVSATLATSMIVEPRKHLFSTFRRKQRPSNIRVLSKSAVGCVDQSCVLPLVKKTIEKGVCQGNGCSQNSTQVLYRNEQKLVDTMLSCDMLATTGDTEVVILISGDDDFLPPLRVLALREQLVVRVHPKNVRENEYYPADLDNLIEMEIGASI